MIPDTKNKENTWSLSINFVSHDMNSLHNYTHRNADYVAKRTMMNPAPSRKKNGAILACFQNVFFSPFVCVSLRVFETEHDVKMHLFYLIHFYSGPRRLIGKHSDFRRLIDTDLLHPGGPVGVI